MCLPKHYTMQATATCSRGLDNKTPLLRTSHTLVTGHAKITVMLTREFPPYCLAFIVLEDAMHANCGDKSV